MIYETKVLGHIAKFLKDKLSLEELKANLLDLDFHPFDELLESQDMSLIKNKLSLYVEYKIEDMKINYRNSSNVVYHSVDLNRVQKILEEDKIYGYTNQKITNQGKYQTLKGISTTRDLNYAIDWNSIILVLDLDKIKNKCKVIPFNWGKNDNYKKEREEFVKLGSIDHDCKLKYNKNFIEELEELESSKDNMSEEEYLNLVEFYKEEGEKYDVNLLTSCIGELDINNCLVGILFDSNSYLISLEYDSRDLNFLLSHDKFIGLV